MWYVGIDIHWRSAVLCILDAQGKQVKELSVRGSWQELLTAVQELRPQFPGAWKICFEASAGYGWLYDHLAGLAQQVLVAHPGLLRLIFRTKRKNDRVDAHKLATLLFLDQVPAVHVPDLDVRAWRTLIEYRRRLVDKRTRCKNGLKSLLRNCGLAYPRGRKLWTKAGRQWLEQLPLPHPVVAVQRRCLLEELRQYDQQIAQVTRELDDLAQRHPAVALLRTIPGIGPRTAEAMVAYIDKPQRFASSRQVSAYVGLVPQQDASGARNRLGHITKNGPPTLRKLLVEAAWQVIRHAPAAKKRFETVHGGKKERRKVALVAVANWLARVMGAMLRTGEAWREAA